VTITPDSPRSRSRLLIVALVVAAIIVALLPAAISRTRRVQLMRVELAAALGECRARYAAARTAVDTAAADSVRPSFHGAQRPGDPACGPYRRRNMLR
jgi:type II secretory pathway pseudopilin PulG